MNTAIAVGVFVLAGCLCLQVNAVNIALQVPDENGKMEICREDVVNDIKNVCGRYTCSRGPGENAGLTLVGCGTYQIACPKGQVVHRSEDRTKQYPNCCPVLTCRPAEPVDSIV